MSDKEILVIKKKQRDDKIKIKVVRFNSNDCKYEKIIPNKDYNHLAELFFDLNRMGYNIEKAFSKFKEFLDEPELFLFR